MLENALTNRNSHIDYKEKAKALRIELSALQLKIRDAKLPVIIIFEGWGASGKGSMIAEVIKYLDPRFFKVSSTVNATDEEKRYPMMKRFWDNIPEYGKISVMDRSWYRELAIAKMEQDISKDEYKQRVNRVGGFEKLLSDDGYLIIKFFLHISKDEQKKRFEKLRSNKETEWRYSETDKKRHKHYDEYYDAFDDMLERTDFPFSPWNVICTEDKAYSRCKVMEILVDRITEALDGKRVKTPASAEYPLIKMNRLSDICLEGKEVSPEDYEARLKAAQKELSVLHSRLYAKKIPMLLCFEGWDAAGKGGAIKRIASALDPRGYEAVPVSAPDKTELNHHYLWRFWKHVPKSGHIAIFDRTWYGRVMVEKIEGFTPLSRCEEAFDEINAFEKELTDSGAIVLKFWLQIDKDEQLARFTARQNTPEKQWKITDEDWRNREKWDSYEAAVDEMLEKTSTVNAPWTVVEANNKLYARLKVLETVIAAVKDRLD